MGRTDSGEKGIPQLWEKGKVPRQENLANPQIGSTPAEVLAEVRAIQQVSPAALEAAAMAEVRALIHLQHLVKQIPEAVAVEDISQPQAVPA